MGPQDRRARVGFSKTLLILMAVLFSASVQAAVLYKSYIIRESGGQDILCDPYIVQKDDYVLKIFRQRGEISQNDFPEFLKIFEDVNPQVQDINKILPGQHIFIPLKKLEPASVPDQEFGVVTIPFVTQMEIEEILKNHADVIEVKSGDTVSMLLSAHFGRYGTEAYNEGLNLFKTLNPQVKDVNLILVGEQLWLPRRTLQNEPWYGSLFDAASNLALSSPEVSEVSEAETGKKEEGAGVQTGTRKGGISSSLADVAEILEARIYQKGTYYFPRPGRSDLQLDLTKHPLLETGDGARVLISITDEGRKMLSTESLSVLKKFWKDLVVADIPGNAALDQIFDAVISSLPGGSISKKKIYTDNGIEVTIQPQWMLEQPRQSRRLAVTPIRNSNERTPQAVIDYLKTLGVILKEVILSDAADTEPPASKAPISFGQVPALDLSLDKRAFVRNFFGIAGITYQENTTVNFGYAGIQIQAVTNALNRPDGLLTLVDFEDLQGEAVETLEKAGFKLFQVPLEGQNEDLIPDLFGAAGMTCENPPTFEAVEGAEPGAITIALSGFLGKNNETPKVLLTSVQVPDDLIRFFKEKDIDVVLLVNAAGG